MIVPFVNPGLQYKQFREEILRRFDRISLTGNYVLGDELKEFEKNFTDEEKDHLLRIQDGLRYN